MMQTKLIYSISAVAAATILLVGCGDKKEPEAKAQTPQTSTTATPATPSEAEWERLLDAKMNRYIDCYNVVDGRLRNSIERYTSWVKDLDAGPTGKERVVYGIYEVRSDDLNACSVRV